MVSTSEKCLVTSWHSPNKWSLLLGNWPLSSWRLVGCMKRNIKHRRTQDHTRFPVLLLFCGSSTVFTVTKSSCKQCPTRDNCPVRANHTKGKTNPARSWLTPRAASHSPVPGRGTQLDALLGKLSGREGTQQVQMAVLHSLTQCKHRFTSVWTRFLRREQE